MDLGRNVPGRLTGRAKVSGSSGRGDHGHRRSRVHPVGPVQVEPTLADGRITDVEVRQSPNGNGRNQRINASTLPILAQETIPAQSAQIDMVRGATVTSEGCPTSRQGARSAGRSRPGSKRQASAPRAADPGLNE